MMYRLAIQPEAQSDLDQAYKWYENQRSGLGSEFIRCVEAVFETNPRKLAQLYPTGS